MIHNWRSAMKKKSLLIGMMIMGCILFFSSCRDIRTTTRIFSDGSCERIVTVMGDSSAAWDLSYPVPHDSTWSMKYNNNADPKTYTAVKRFEHISDLDRELSEKPDSLYQVQISIRLKKNFRWFSTIFRYEEVYKAANPFPDYPISKYLNPDELTLYYSNEDTLDLDDRVDEWYDHAMFNEFFQKLESDIDSLNRPELTRTMIEAKRDTLSKLLDKDIPEEQIPEIFESVLGTKVVLHLSEEIKSHLNLLEKKGSFIINLYGNYENQVIMPGLVFDTNAKILEGNTVTWKFESRRFLWEDYTMWVESRVVNRWAMIVTGILSVILVAGLIFGAIFKKKIQEATVRIQRKNSSP
jgi:hypothetical protein